MTGKSSFLITLVALLVFPAFLQAQKRTDLKDIAESASYKRISRLTYKEDLQRYRGKWVKHGQNYTKLFKHKAAIQLVDAWLDTPDIVLRELRSQARTIGKFIHLGRTYESTNRKEILFDVFIPHPRHVMEAEYKLIDPFRGLQPPALRTETIEEIYVQEHQAFIYELKNKRCSVFMKMAKGSILNISGECTETEDMITLANSLSIDRFNQMMNS